jgi:hypothetical protein
MLQTFRKAALDQSAKTLIAFLEQNKKDKILDYPFGSMYPANGCEGASLIFAYLVEEKYGATNISIYKGTKPRKSEHHYWVTVGDLHYDLTCHQFSGRKPIIGKLGHSFFFSYSEWRLEVSRDFVDRNEVVALFRSGVIPF